ncbi:unnamed protein product [Ectocarpus sp. 13 AM-2016]
MGGDPPRERLHVCRRSGWTLIRPRVLSTGGHTCTANLPWHACMRMHAYLYLPYVPSVTSCTSTRINNASCVCLYSTRTRYAFLESQHSKKKRHGKTNNLPSVDPLTAEIHLLHLYRLYTRQFPPPITADIAKPKHRRNKKERERPKRSQRPVSS